MLLVIAVLTGFVKELNINYPVHFFLTLSMINLEIVHLDVALLKLDPDLDPSRISDPTADTKEEGGIFVVI
jgi:hypothetical protein